MIKQIKNSYCCVGLMSGTSLDGLDLVLCEFKRQSKKWSYQIEKYATVAYLPQWKKRLQQAPDASGRELMQLHRDYGRWMAKEVEFFIKDAPSQPDMIASHGHTVFHEPASGMNFQLGDGHVIAAETGITTISDFRSLDVCLNGQGAPLVPIGDELLFSEYQACVNIGGFVNISCNKDNERIAWDICPANFIANRLVEQKNLSMDEDGAIGAVGQVIDEMLDELNELPYYKQTAPKSLAQEWVERFIWPLLNKYQHYSLSERLRTFYEHMATIIANDLNKQAPAGTYLFTGGGVYNGFLMTLIREKVKGKVVIPDNVLVEFKEALVFSLLGLLRLTGETNCLKSVTGASRDCSSGSICG